MSTNSFIGMIEHNVLRGIYCHWDGYPSNNGVILNEHYQDDSKIRELIALGDISYLAEKVKPDNDGNKEDVVCAYGRDRAEEGTEAVSFIRIENFANYIKEFYYDYIYIRYNHKWYVVKQIHNDHIDCIELDKVLKSLKNDISGFNTDQKITLNQDEYNKQYK